MPLELAFSHYAPERGGEEPGKVPLVVLHGLMGSGRNWASVARSIAEDRSVFCLDARNHGDSPHSETMGYPEMVSDVEAFLDRQGLDRAVLLGHSMGGKTAMRLALSNPGRIGGLVIVDISPRPFDPGVRGFLLAMETLPLHVAGSRSDVDELLADVVDEPVTRQFFMQNVVRDDAGGFRWRVNLTAINRWYGGVVETDDLSGSYAGPLLALAGEKSPAVGDRRDYEPWFPEARVLRVPGAGHWPQADNPQFVITALRRFLRDVSAPQSDEGP